MSATLFDTLPVGNLILKNRMIMAPMTRSRADNDGLVGDLTVTYYHQRASAGLIVTEATNVSPMAKGYLNTPGSFNEAQNAAWRKVTEAVHDAGGKIFMQLFHTGRIALPDFLPGNTQPVAPSAIAAQGQNFTMEGMKPFVTPRALERSEIPGVIDEFRQATENAFLAGFNGVELHAASGYLVQQFLMPGSNQRTDEYGGSLPNRMRFLHDVLNAMVSVRGPERVGVKFSPQMPFNDIQEPDAEAEYPQIIESLNGKGLAYVHVAKNNAVEWHDLLRPKYKGTYFAGAGLTQETATELLEAEKADAAVFGKLFVANPDLPERFKQSGLLNEPDASTFYQGGAHGYTDYPTLP